MSTVLTLPNTQHSTWTLLRRSESPRAALQHQLNETHRCHWQIWASPSAWLPLQSAFKPTSAACVGASRAKPQTRTADSCLLMTPVTSLLDPEGRLEQRGR